MPNREISTKLGLSTDSIVKAVVKKTMEDLIKQKRTAKPIQKPAAKAAEVKTFAQRQVEVAAVTNTVKALPKPTKDQIAAAGGGVLGYLRATRELQRSSE
jgi:outer membrane biosynthesis protein TonB